MLESPWRALQQAKPQHHRPRSSLAWLRTEAKDLLAGIQPAPVKSIARMLNKLQSDHKDKDMPRPKWNVDTVRAGVVVHDAALIEAVYAAIGERVGPYLRVKNGFAANESNYGYRASHRSLSPVAP